MRKPPAYEEKVKRAIRDAMAIDPIMTQTALLDHLERKFKHSFDHRYVNKLTNKVLIGARVEADHTAIETRLSQMRESYRLVRERYMRILFWTPESAAPGGSLEGIKPPLPIEIVKAGEALVMLDIAIFNAETANGLYRKPVEQLASEFEYRPLPEEVRTRIVETWIRWGPLPKAAVREMVDPEPHAETKLLTAGT